MSVFIPQRISVPPNVDITSNATLTFKFNPNTTEQKELGRVWGIVSIMVWAPNQPMFYVVPNTFTLYLFVADQPGLSFLPPDPDKAFLSFSDSFTTIAPLIATPGGTLFTYLVVQNKTPTATGFPIYVTLGLRK